MRFAAILLFAVVISPLTLRAEEPSEKAPEKTTSLSPEVQAKTKAEFDHVMTEWRAALAKLAEQQSKLQGASSATINAMKPEYLALVEQAGKLTPQLQAAAEAAFKADPSDKTLGDLLYWMTVYNLRRDHYEPVLEIAQLLIANNHNAVEAKRLAASAAFATMDLDLAEKLTKELIGEQKPVPDDLQALLDEISKYRPKWQRERKLRDADTKADNLPRVELQTSHGDIVLELFENDAPNTVANFINLVEQGFYDGTQFHRVLPAFMAQGGDPNTKPDGKGQPGTGGPGYTIACECYDSNQREHFRGTLSMAHAGKDTGGSQFFLTFVPTEQLDGRHTVFGRVVEGMPVLAKLRRIDPEKSTATGDRLEKATVLRKRDHAYVPRKIAEK